jgi:hypothetical protein
MTSAFAEKLSAAQQRLHLVAIAPVAAAIAIMTPAAYHRQTDRREVSESFLRPSTRLVPWSMLPLAVAICLDFYLVGSVILRSHWVALPAAALFAAYTGLWFVIPRSRRLRRSPRAAEAAGTGAGDSRGVQDFDASCPNPLTDESVGGPAGR